MSKTVSQVGESQCPNCAGIINIPKSTRSIICRHCDAVIKIIDKDEGVELKVVGRSVAENPTYQELETQVAAIKEHLKELHVEYEAEMARPMPKGMLRVGMLGLLAIFGGLVALLFDPQVGGIVVLVGLVMTIAGFAMHSRTKRAKFATGMRMSKQIEQVGAQRDLLQRKAARLKTEV